MILSDFLAGYETEAQYGKELFAWCRPEGFVGYECGSPFTVCSHAREDSVRGSGDDRIGDPKAPYDAYWAVKDFRCHRNDRWSRKHLGIGAHQHADGLVCSAVVGQAGVVVVLAP